MATRPLELEEYKKIIELFLDGFVNKDDSVFRPNKQIASLYSYRLRLAYVSTTCLICG